VNTIWKYLVPAVCICAGAHCSEAAEQEWSPEADYAREMGTQFDPGKASAKKGESTSAAADFHRTWPLPVTGSWNTEAHTPLHYAQMIRDGHHPIMTFVDPVSRAMYVEYPANEKWRAGAEDEAAKALAEYFRPGLEFARERKLPIVIRGWNWADQVMKFQELRAKISGKEIPGAQIVNAIVDGKKQKLTDPFGPIEPWREWGAFWMGNKLIREMQAIYPDPPMVIFLDNNESGEITGANGQIAAELWKDGVAKFDRFVAKYGKKYGEGSHNREFQADAVRKGYAERYAAMFDAGKEAFTAPAWKKNARFVAYNTLAGAAYLGNGKVPNIGFGFDAKDGWTKWLQFDGSMPELYDNDWQPGKRDDIPWSMQSEAGNMAAILPWAFGVRPNLIWSTIFWDGGFISQVDRGIRGTSKTYWYATSGFRWDFARYEGWVQFCLWTIRPAIAFEFREPGPLTPVGAGTWMALNHSVNRPWTNQVLRAFWEQGRLVPNTAEPPWFNEFPEGAPDWIRALPRCYQLTCDANNPRAEWGPYTRLRVFAMALVLGDAPARRWLVYAHAPNGGVSDTSVALPGFGNVRLPAVPRSGSFFTVDEKGGAVEVVLPGGPDEVVLAESRAADADWPRAHWTKPGEPARFVVSHALSPGRRIESVTWDFGDGTSTNEKSLSGTSHVFDKPGVYLVSVRVKVSGPAETLLDQTPAYIGEAPDQDVVYDLPLDDAPAWEGPWCGIGGDGRTLATYRHLPNRGSLSAPIMTGGRFVTDPERGRVLELEGDHSGIWLARHKATTVSGPKGVPNRTVSFWFKAEDAMTRQVLFSSGWEENGVNIYLDKGMLYAGSWALLDGPMERSSPPRWGYNWKGDWISAGPVETGRWYHVAWVLKDGTNRVEPDKQHLYLDGKLAGTAPGAAIPPEYIPPRVGRTNFNKSGIQRVVSRTRFHDQDVLDQAKPSERVTNFPAFRGRLDDFRFVNAAEEFTGGKAVKDGEEPPK
jgi:hypothetical protein